VNNIPHFPASAADQWAAIPPEYRALATRLRAAEDQVFPLVMVDADRYQRAVTLIGLLTGYLTETAATLADLEDGHAAAVANAREIASRQALPVGDLDLDLVVDAAMSQRFRTLLALTAQDRTSARVEEARAAGLDWVTVSEPDAATLGMSPSQEWVEVHLASGAELIRSISMRPDTGEPVFHVTFVDHAKGRETVECADRTAWLATADQWRRNPS
jgi:hypothetical protein